MGGKHGFHELDLEFDAALEAGFKGIQMVEK
jgi:hypothetical protein